MCGALLIFGVDWISSYRSIAPAWEPSGRERDDSCKRRRKRAALREVVKSARASWQVSACFVRTQGLITSTALTPEIGKALTGYLRDGPKAKSDTEGADLA